MEKLRNTEEERKEVLVNEAISLFEMGVYYAKKKDSFPDSAPSTSPNPYLEKLVEKGFLEVTGRLSQGNIMYRVTPRGVSFYMEILQKQQRISVEAYSKAFEIELPNWFSHTQE